MCDLQLVTGFSILISGFSQLPCGLPVIYWNFILSLAWLSCFTHLAGVTLLRRHLFTHSIERLRRLVAMGALAVFVVVGLFYQLSFDTNNPHSTAPAICHFGSAPRMKDTDLDSWSVLVSILLIIFGLTSQLIKMQPFLSVKIIGGARSCLSLRLRTFLKVIFKSWCKSGKRKCVHLLCYRPLLAAFLYARFLLDVWNSLLFEVSCLSRACISYFQKSQSLTGARWSGCMPHLHGAYGMWHVL